MIVANPIIKGAARKNAQIATQPTAPDKMSTAVMTTAKMGAPTISCFIACTDQSDIPDVPHEFDAQCRGLLLRKGYDGSRSRSLLLRNFRLARLATPRRKHAGIHHP